MGFSGRDNRDFHVFVTPHPYMIEMGLGVFTTGTLYDWWNKRNSFGVYYNRLLINEPAADGLANPPNDLSRLLGVDPYSTEFFWNGWKPDTSNQNTGRYQRQDLSEYIGGGQQGWSFQSEIGTVYTSDIDLPYYAASDPIIGGTIDENLVFSPILGTKTTNPNGSNESDVLKTLKPVYEIINLNQFWNNFTSFFPRSNWEPTSSNSIGGVNSRTAIASNEFLSEIKTAKFGPHIEWSGEVSFRVNELGGALNCVIKEWVPFKLYLFDEPSAPSQNKTVSFKNPTFVAPRKTPTGKNYSNSSDGGYSDFNPDNIASQVAGELDLTYDEVKKNWKSGNKILFAKMITDLPAAINSPDVDTLVSSDIQESLDSEEITNKFVASSGSALPVFVQNGNPLQWQPSYAMPDDERCFSESKDKETLTVYNHNSKRSYVKGEEVLLIEINGLLQVVDPGTDTGGAGTVEAGVGKWGEFTYLMTNNDFFFTDNEGERFSPRDAELAFHRAYYDSLSGFDNILNGGISGINYLSDGGYDILPFNTLNVTPFVLNHGFVQTTSFDYLDGQVCGLKDKCSIAHTNATKTSDGKTIPFSDSEYANRNAAMCGVFFGCIFPDGYTGFNNYLAARDWSIQTSSSGDTPRLFFNVDNQSTGILPFQDTTNIGENTPGRNNCRQPAVANADDELTFDNCTWDRQMVSDFDPNVYNRTSASIFADQNTLSSMPADVMLNGSPSATNGSPLFSVHRFKDFHSTNSGEMVKKVKDAFLDAYWLSKNGDGYTKEDSAFDFTPISPSKLMFRPLKLEAYVQFGSNLLGDNAAKVRDFSEDGSHKDRITFQLEAARTQLDLTRPCASSFEEREFYTGHPLWNNNNYGLKWGGDVEHRAFYNYLHETDYWRIDNGALEWVKNFADTLEERREWLGASAYGIITTYNTISANTSITFNTSNLYGMGAEGEIQFGEEAKGNKSWGVSNFDNSYRQQNILDLSVRVFHHHPANQTLFDPRTFAVHHFNPGVDRVGDENRQTSTVSFSNEFNDYTYKYKVSEFDVDYREPSRYVEQPSTHGAGNEFEPELVPYFSSVFSDATYDDNEQKPPMMERQYWQLNVRRVGKLLPFRYLRNILTAPIRIAPNSILNGRIDFRTGDSSIRNTDLNSTQAKDIKDKLVVFNFGTSYQVGDLIGNDTYNVTFEVKEVGSNGEIHVLEPIKDIIYAEGSSFKNREDEIPPSLFFSHTDELNPNSRGGLTLSTIESQEGSDFGAFFVNGRIQAETYTDPKPYIVRNEGETISRIAANKSLPNNPDGVDLQLAKTSSFITDNHSVVYTLDEGVRSSDSKYDAFFHFHNDITMTWLASSQQLHGNITQGNITDAHEQYILVDIDAT